MPEPSLLERAAGRAPTPSFTLDDVQARRERAQRRRRVTSGAVGGFVTLALIALAVAGLGPFSSDGSLHVAHGGVGLPPATQVTPTAGPNQYTYQHLVYSSGCGTLPADQSTCPDNALDIQSWWKRDGSGRIQTTEQRNYGLKDGTFGPGEFPTEGALNDFPTNPDALRTFLLDRSGPDGASPRPDVTPAPGVSLDDGLLWNSIRDYLGSTQYLNTTPALRASMLEVLATVPMVSVDTTAHDPVARDAIALRFFAYEEDVVVYVDPATHDFLAMSTTNEESSYHALVVVESAGIVRTTDEVPTGRDRSIPTASLPS
jgi:hypothetical protein